MVKEEYNWWTDPKNKLEVERMSWWKHEDNKYNFPFPISVAKGEHGWTATCNEETISLIGDMLHGCASGKTKEEAIEQMFELIKMTHEFSIDCMLSYQRWVPFRKGDWGHVGGSWFIIFGIQVYFRYGDGMKHGFYIPFTKLNISFNNEWTTYRKWKLENVKK